jgi:hypothetical protein
VGESDIAIVQRYRKVRETGQEVEYTYGFPEMDRRLTIDTTSGTCTVADGREDHATLAVIRGIGRRFRAESTWPNGGGVQH